MIHPLTFFGAGSWHSRSSLPWFDVADQEVRASPVTLFADLGQQVCHRNLRVLDQPATQMIPVGIDQGGPMPRWALELPSSVGAGIPLDRVQRPAQAPGALEQTGTLSEQIVNRLVPPGSALINGPRRPGRGGNRLEDVSCAGSETTGMGEDGLLDGLAETVPQVPAVTHLDSSRRAVPDGL
jgi:hypothetical protein